MPGGAHATSVVLGPAVAGLEGVKKDVKEPVEEHEIEHDPDESGATHGDARDRKRVTRLITFLDLSTGNNAEDDAHDRSDPVEPDDAQHHRRDGETVHWLLFVNEVHGFNAGRDEDRCCGCRGRYVVRKRVDSARRTKLCVVAGWVSVRAVHISPVARWPPGG